MARILVTGGLGYIGSHTVVTLLQEGYDVVVIDNLSNSCDGIVEGITTITGKPFTFVRGDCTDKVLVEKLFTEYPMDGVIHFASSKMVGESIQHPLLYYRNNIDSLLTILEGMVRHNVKNIIFSSSCIVYGNVSLVALPITEESPLCSTPSPYGKTKQMAESIICDVAHTDSTFKGILLRYFNPIGAHPSTLIGEKPNSASTNIMSLITQTAIGLRKQLLVFGDDYNTPDGSCIRDYVYVVDLALAHVKALERLLCRQSNERIETFNLGTGRGVSVLKLIHTFIEVTGVNVPYTIVGRREGDIEQIWADTTKANKLLGWSAKAPLKEILCSAWRREQYIRKKD